MVRFYNARNEADLERVEAILKKAGIEYFRMEAPAGSLTMEIEVAEEDVPTAEELLLSSATRGDDPNAHRQ